MGEEADADWQAGLIEWGYEDAEKAKRPLRPHPYVPSYMHMGDCQSCGHTQHAPIHNSAHRVRRVPKRSTP